MKDMETLVIEDIKRRQELGIKKYGKTVAQNNLTVRETDNHEIKSRGV